MTFEPFRSVVLPKGKMGPGLEPQEPAAGRPTRTIILDGPAIDPDAFADTDPAPTRDTTVERPVASLHSPEAVPQEVVSTPAPTVDTAAMPLDDSGTYVLADLDEPSAPPTTIIPTPEPETYASPSTEPTAPARPRSRGKTAPRQFIVAYDGKLVGTYRSAKRIQNRTAYLNVAEQLVGQIEEFDPTLIRLYKLTAVEPPAQISTEDLAESYHNFPRDDVPAPGA
jgi:hypothetical protein